MTTDSSEPASAQRFLETHGDALRTDGVAVLVDPGTVDDRFLVRAQAGLDAAQQQADGVTSLAVVQDPDARDGDLPLESRRAVRQEIAVRAAEDATRADLAGALVLLTAAGRELEQAEDRTSGRTGTRGRAGSTGRAVSGDLCTVDPTHGEAVRRRRVGADRVRMPVCAVCVEDVTAGRTPDWLRDRGRPYVERDTVWTRTRFGASGVDLVDLIRRELVQRQGAD